MPPLRPVFALQNDTTERDPLLGERANTTNHTLPAPPVSRRRVLSLVFALAFVAQFATYMQYEPTREIVQDVVCREHYRNETTIGIEGTMDRDHARCFSAEVQVKVFALLAWTYRIGFIGSLLAVIPYGFVADKFGRKPVLRLSLIGVILNTVACYIICWRSDLFPIKLIWGTSIFTLVGGGTVALEMIVFAIIADIVSEEHRATAFFYVTALQVLVEPAGWWAGGMLAVLSPWLPLMLALGLLVLSLGISYAIPGTVSFRAHGAVPSDLADPAEDELGEDRNSNHPILRSHKVYSNLINFKFAIVDRILLKKNLAMLLFSFLLANIGRSVAGVLGYYIFERYQWAWWNANLLVLIRSASILALLLAILPGACYLLSSKTSLSVPTRDLLLARTSSVLVAIGLLITGTSPWSALMVIGIFVASLGAGYSPLVRSLLTSIVEPYHVSTLYGAMAVLETIGKLTASPFIYACLSKGMLSGGAWYGLPFIIASVLYAIIATIVWSIRLPRAASTGTPVVRPNVPSDEETA